MTAFSRFTFLASLFISASLLACAAPRTVRDFGAVGDGQHDDTEAIQKAVDAGGTVCFPAGKYRVTKSVKVELQKTGPVSLEGSGPAIVEMAGSGPAFHFVGTLKTNIAPEVLPEDFWTKAGSLSVTGLTFVGVNPESVGLGLTRTVQMIISRCTFRQLYHGIHFTEANRNAIIADCHIYNNRNTGIFIDHVDFHQLNIVGNHISYNHGGGIVALGGALRNVQIGTCDIEANVGPGVPPTANIFLDSTGGSIGEVEITGCTIQHFPNTPGFANIRYIGHSTAVSFTTEKRHGNLIISGNMINDADINVHIDGARGVVMSGNTIQLAATHDILIENSSEVVLADTVLDRHPRYRPERTTHGGPVQQGVVIKNSDSCTLSALRINGGKAPAAIDVSGGGHFQISNCTITNVEGIALRLDGIRESIVTGNLLSSSTTGKAALVVRAGAGNLIEGNLVLGRSEIDPASLATAGK